MGAELVIAGVVLIWLGGVISMLVWLCNRSKQEVFFNNSNYQMDDSYNPELDALSQGDVVDEQ